MHPAVCVCASKQCDRIITRRRNPSARVAAAVIIAPLPAAVHVEEVILYAGDRPWINTRFHWKLYIDALSSMA